jgi:hypothetical protein
MAQGWRPDEDQENHEARIISWIEILGTANIPIEHYDGLYRRAMVSRGRKKGEGLSVPYWITPEELIAEHAEFQRDLQAQPRPVEHCSQPHDADRDDRLNIYAVGGVEEIALPCHECRPEAHRKRVVEHLDHSAQKRAARPRLLGAVEINPQQMAAIFSNPHERTPMAKSAVDILNDCYELVKIEWKTTVGEDRKDFLCEIATTLIHAMEYVGKCEKEERRSRS